jgi:hypothetical protein
MIGPELLEGGEAGVFQLLSRIIKMIFQSSSCYRFFSPGIDVTLPISTLPLNLLLPNTPDGQHQERHE